MVTAALDDRHAAGTAETARGIVASVPDPEMPWVNLGDLGVVRAVELLGPEPGHEPGAAPADAGRSAGRGSVRVELTPTYLGCPAVEAMRTDVAAALTAAGYRVESVDLRLDPPWTSAQITEEGRRKLAEAGIAPPAHIGAAEHAVTPLALGVRCPNCGGIETALLSRFGASPCQELRRCSSCAEPFPAVRS
jgi:ring-1,2-phenylacetyl-CoA epoxidase subunit PaaD